MSFLDLSSSPPEGDDFLDWDDKEVVDRSITPRPEVSGTSTPRNGYDTMKEVQVPFHPIRSMQGAFAESFLEANDNSNPIERNRPGTAAARRRLLLDPNTDEEAYAAKWKHRPGQQHHELWKLMAQISFGVYLLLNGIAKDEDQVLKILQTHVNEIDDFLEATLEDFELAQQDIDERLKLLKLPLENILVFEMMLEDRTFRLQIVNGNEQIEHVITQTANAMNESLKDVQQGLEACKEFASYLAQEQDHNSWNGEQHEMLTIFEAMKGNVDGWYKAYVSLQTKGNDLRVACVQLGSIVAEMNRRAGEVSRKTRFSAMAPSEPSPPASPPEDVRTSRRVQQPISRHMSSDNSSGPATRTTLPALQTVQDREESPEPESNTSDVEDELEPTFILKPHTYSPMPSPVPPSEPQFEKLSPMTFQQPFKEREAPPEISKRSSLRKRFSLSRKDSPEPTKSNEIPDEEYWGPRKPVLNVAATIRGRQTSLATPPSRGLDSAYCSDFEKSSPQTISMVSHQASNSRSTLSRFSTLETPPSIAPESIIILPSPRSDQQQFFRPVNASPHSPLQRPWTAGPSSPNPLHSYNSSSSNLAAQRPPFNHTHSHTPSILGNRRGAPSAMGMSMNSEITVGLDENGKKIKKKRSAFGWFKKAFSLSEEEKAAFEERRRMITDREKEYAKPPEKIFLDGKRIDPHAVRARRKASGVPLNAYH